MSKEKPKWRKTWRELSKEERTPEEWNRRTEKICPFTRKPCIEKINQDGPDEPENYRACVFWNDEWEECRATTFLRGFEEFESLVEIMGVFFHKKITGDLPKLNKNPRFWEWEI